MKLDEKEALERSVASGDFSFPGMQYKWLSPVCCVAWDAETSTLTLGDAVDCQVYSYSEAAGLAAFLERVLPDPSDVLEKS